MKKSMVSHGTSKRRTQLCTFIKVFMKWNFVHQRFYLVCDDSFLVPKVSEELLDTKSRIPKMHRTSSDSFFFFPLFLNEAMAIVKPSRKLTLLRAYFTYKIHLN